MNKLSAMPDPPKTVFSNLAWFYNRNGYVRSQNKERMESEGSGRYKKGEEVRLIAYSEHELKVIQSLLSKAGFKYGKPFRKKTLYCQPVYGRQAVARFLQMVESVSGE
jgi:hypothetical protein